MKTINKPETYPKSTMNTVFHQLYKFSVTQFPITYKVKQIIISILMKYQEFSFY